MIIKILIKSNNMCNDRNDITVGITITTNIMTRTTRMTHSFQASSPDPNVDYTQHHDWHCYSCLVTSKQTPGTETFVSGCV